MCIDRLNDWGSCGFIRSMLLAGSMASGVDDSVGRGQFGCFGGLDKSVRICFSERGPEVALVVSAVNLRIMSDCPLSCILVCGGMEWPVHDIGLRLRSKMFGVRERLRDSSVESQVLVPL